MNSKDYFVKIEPISNVDGGYMLLPYVKIENDNVPPKEQETESVLYVSIIDELNNDDGKIVEVTSEPDFLNDHNYLAEETEINKQQCTFCDKVLSTPGALMRHMRVHTGEQPYQCQLCDKKFTQQSNLWKHILVHTGERRFDCEYCDKKFSQRANMEKHLRIHTGEKPFKCSVCEKEFTQRANLNKHERTHTGEKPYSCQYCSRSFAQLSNKQKHELLHEGIKPFACTICSVAFTQQGNLKKHLLTHNNASRIMNCKFCKKMYIKKRNLQRHQEECESLHFLYKNFKNNSPDETHKRDG